MGDRGLWEASCAVGQLRCGSRGQGRCTADGPHPWLQQVSAGPPINAFRRMHGSFL